MSQKLHVLARPLLEIKWKKKSWNMFFKFLKRLFKMFWQKLYFTFAQYINTSQKVHLFSKCIIVWAFQSITFPKYINLYSYILIFMKNIQKIILSFRYFFITEKNKQNWYVCNMQLLLLLSLGYFRLRQTWFVIWISFLFHIHSSKISTIYRYWHCQKKNPRRF